MIGRRAFLTGLGASLVAAPAIVRAASLMPIRGVSLAPSGALLDDAFNVLNGWLHVPDTFFVIRGGSRLPAARARCCFDDRRLGWALRRPLSPCRYCGAFR